MDNFSHRNGLIPPIPLQKDRIDQDLRIALWNLIYPYFEKSKHTYSDHLFKNIWVHYLKLPVDEIPMYLVQYTKLLKKHLLECEWYRFYDLIEMISEGFDSYDRKKFNHEINKTLEKENSAYRIVDVKMAPIIDDAEIKTIEKSLATHSSASIHITKALSHLSDKENPDYKNSIKESISAIESILREKLNEPHLELSRLLNELKKRSILHPSFIQAIDKLYGYTSDASGIRHSEKKDGLSLDYHDALCMLVICSAIVNRISALEIQ